MAPRAPFIGGVKEREGQQMPSESERAWWVVNGKERGRNDYMYTPSVCVDIFLVAPVHAPVLGMGWISACLLAVSETQSRQPAMSE